MAEAIQQNLQENRDIPKKENPEAKNLEAQKDQVRNLANHLDGKITNEPLRLSDIVEKESPMQGKLFTAFQKYFVERMPDENRTKQALLGMTKDKFNFEYDKRENGPWLKISYGNTYAYMQIAGTDGETRLDFRQPFDENSRIFDLNDRREILNRDLYRGYSNPEDEKGPVARR